MIASPFPPPDPDARMRQIRARAHESDLNTPGQHTLTQALLKRFTRPVLGNKWQLLKIDLRRESIHRGFSSTKGCGVVEEFVPYASTSLEQYWSAIETPFHAAFASVDDGTLFDRPDQLSVVRDMVALHYIRSPKMKHVHDETFRNGQAIQRAAWRSRPGDLQRLYREKTGLHVTGSEAIEYILDQLMEASTNLATTGALARERLPDMYEKVRTVLDGFTIEVLRPETGEFLIGDIPVLDLNPGHALSTAGDVALPDDDILALPLGRRHLAWLHRGPRTGYCTIATDQVEMLNARQILAAQEYVFAHPEGALESFVAQVHAAQNAVGPTRTAEVATET